MTVPALRVVPPDDSDRLPPYNLEAERGVLGACLLDNDRIDECVLAVSPADFYRPQHEIVWRMMIAMRDTGEGIDGVTLADALMRGKVFDRIGGDELLDEIAFSVRHAANAAYHAGIVRQKAIARRLIQTAEEILNACYANMNTADELLAMAERRIFAIGEQRSGSTILDMPAIVDEAMARIQRRRDGEFDGFLTGFEDLDYMLAGLRPGQLILLGARPSMGKTAMGMAIAANVATTTGLPAFFVSLEMGAAEIAERFLSAWAEVSSYKIKLIAPLGDDGWDRLCQAAGRLHSLPFRIDAEPAQTVSRIAANARRIKRSSSLSLITVDYLGLIDAEKQRGESTNDAMARVSRSLKRMAREIGVPVLALHQLNRQSEGREDKRPRMSDLRDSGAIEQDADIVLLLHRPEYYDPNDQPGVAELIIAKNRNGATGRVDFAFLKQWAKFAPLSREVQPEGGHERPF